MNKERVEALNIIRTVTNSTAADLVKNCSGEKFDSEAFDISIKELKTVP